MRRSLWRGLGIVALGLIFLGVSLAGSLLHLGLPPGRRVVARVVVALLERTFEGRFEVGEVSQLSPVSGVVERFIVREPRGSIVLDARGVRVRASVFDIVRALVQGDEKATVAIQYTRVERVKVVLAPEPGKTELGLVSAFTPRPGAPEPPGTVHAPPPRVWLGAVQLGQASAHAELPGLPVLDGEVTGAQGQVLVSPVGVAVDAARFSAVVRGLLAQELRAVGSFHQRGTTHFWSSLDGYAGDLQFDSIVRLDGRHLAVTLDVPRGEPKVVRALLPAWPLQETATAHVEAQGDLPTLALDGRGTLGDATIGARGTLAFSPEVRLLLAAHGEAIDLRAVFPDAPATRITAASDVDLRSSDAGVQLDLNGTSQPAVLAGAPLPGSAFQAHYDARGLSGSATLHEEGMPLDGKFSLQQGVFRANVHVPRFELGRAPRVASLLGARGGAALDGSVTLASDKLDASVTGSVDGLSLGALTLGRGRLTARANGLLSAPRRLKVDGSMDGSRLRFGELVFDGVDARVGGTLGGMTVSTKLAGARGLSVEASTRVAALGGTRLDQVEITMTREGKSLHGRAGRIVLSEQSLEASEVRLEGAGGTLAGSGRYRPGLLELDLRGHELDLAVLGHVLGEGPRHFGGKASLSAEVALARDVRRGTVSFSLRDGAAGPVTGLSLDLSTTLEEESLTGNALVEQAGVGRARTSFTLTVPGSLLDQAAWRRATGRCDLGLEELLLVRLRSLLPEALGIRELTGKLVAQATLSRDAADDPPSVALLAATDGLALVRDAGDGTEPIRLSGIELQTSAHLEGKQGFAQVDLKLLDEQGLLSSASGRLDLDVRRALAAPRETWNLVRSSPIVATVVVDGRPLDELPAPFRPTGLAGTLRTELGLRGTLAEPRLSAKASLEHLTIGDSPDVVPFDACGSLQYDPSTERLGVGVQLHRASASSRACSEARVATATATGTVDRAALLAGERGFRGEAQLSFEDFPLELVPVLAESGMLGTVRGVAALTDGGELPAVNARLRLSDVTVRKIPVGGGDLTLRSDGRALSAGVKLERAGGTLDAEAHATLAWEHTWPMLDRGQPVGVRAEIHDIDAAILSPIVGDVLADLSGRLEGSAALTLAPRADKPGASSSLGDLSGSLALRDGSMQLAGLGMRLSKLAFDAQARRVGGRTVVSVRNVSAASGSKYPNVSASGDLYLTGLSLTDVRANVNLNQVPLRIQGVSQATLTGSAALELFPDKRPVLVAIQLHELTAALPRTSGRAVLAVDDNPDIVVKQPLREPVRTTQGGALAWELAFDLARKVRVTRADMEVPLRGRPVVDLGEQTNVRGDLELDAGGRVQLLGKGFVIESGELHFDTPDPADPHLRVLASWRAPDGTTVYVEVGGTVKEATLRLTSDPALPPAEIEALLLGGGSGDRGEAQAAGVGYGADFVGQLLADTPLSRVELRTGAERTADDRSYSTYTAAVPVSENVWVELSYKNLETSGPVERSDAASATVDWRFKRDWSLRTEAGTIGTGLDLLWQYRY